MAQNQNNPFIYLTVPYRYNCVYQKLLRKLADLGIDILNDCGATCRGINRNIINCWNMFQAACGAYALGEGKKADLLINYINIQLKFGCPLLDEETEPPVIKAPAIKTFDIPAVRDVYPGVVNITNVTLTFENPELFKENSLRIGASYEGTRIDTVLAENLPIADNPILNDVTFEVKPDRNYFESYAIFGFKTLTVGLRNVEHLVETGHTLAIYPLSQLGGSKLWHTQRRRNATQFIKRHTSQRLQFFRFLIFHIEKSITY